MAPEEPGPAGEAEASPAGEAETGRAKDLLPEMEPRPVVGQALVRRLAARRWGRGPATCCSPRIFERYAMADPFDPSAEEASSVKLGPVGLKFKERREPARHAQVKDPQKKKKSSQVWSAPSGIPKAQPAPAPTPKPSPPPAAASKAPPPPDAEQEAPLERAPPRIVAPRSARAASGRFRMQRTSTRAPKVRPLPAGPQLVPDAPTDSSRSDEPGELSAKTRPGPPGPVSLDDLFGAATAAGRDKRLGRKPDPKKDG